MRNLNFPNHRWSGWPGAYCFYCGGEDLNEICVANHNDDCNLLECQNKSCPANEQEKRTIDEKLDM